MRAVAEAVVGASIVAVLYAIGRALVASSTTGTVDWIDVNSKALVAFILAGVLIGALRGWQSHREGSALSGHNLGIILAIVSGLFLVGYAIWAAPFLQTGGNSGSQIVSVVVGIGFVVAAFLTGRSAVLSKAILALGVLALLASWLLTGQVVGADRGWFLTAITLLPMVLAALAAFMIGPAERGAVP
jgi:hypothetical protein